MYYSIIIIFILISLIIPKSKTTTEWFGDARAHMNPPQQPPFYDIVYDETDCPFGLESIAIPEYVYFGEMIAAKHVREHSLCLQYCLETNLCKAVNYFESTGEKKDQKTGFCELLIETQYDNPRLMRPFRKATYYEKIKCRTSVEGEEVEQPFEFDSNKGKDLFSKNGRKLQEEKKEKSGEISGRKSVFETNKSNSNEKGSNNIKQKELITEKTQGSNISSSKNTNELLERQNQENERKIALKKLSKKIQEFRFMLLKSR